MTRDRSDQRVMYFPYVEMASIISHATQKCFKSLRSSRAARPSAACLAGPLAGPLAETTTACSGTDDKI